MDQQYKLALKIILTVFLLVGAIWFVREIVWVINLIFISVLIVYAISPTVSFLVKKKVPHWLSVGLVYLALLAFFVLMFYLVIPIIFDEIVQLTQLLPRYIVQLQPTIFEFVQMVQNPEFEEVLETFINQVPLTFSSC
ncbi:MAG: AI-2E family transporter [Bacillota bacterium]|nr:AI-2E family transporter [Bacillota bacterium]